MKIELKRAADKTTTKPEAAPPTAGAKAEAAAEHYLRDHGLHPIARNFSCKLGEIDLIMRDGNTLVFIEVRFRKSNRFGSAIETVTRSKQQKIQRTAQYYLMQQANSANMALRFDVIGMSESETQWIKSAF